MVLVTSNWRIWAAGMLASLAIFAVVFFTVVQPSTTNANQAVKSATQQARQLVKQTEKQLSNVTGQTTVSIPAAATTQPSSAVSQVKSAVGQASQALSQAGGSTQAQQQLATAGNLATCVAAAGANSAQIEACQTKYQP